MFAASLPTPTYRSEMRGQYILDSIEDWQRTSPRPLCVTSVIMDAWNFDLGMGDDLPMNLDLDFTPDGSSPHLCCTSSFFYFLGSALIRCC